MLERVLVAEYRMARDRLLEQEIELRRGMESVAAAPRELPPGGPVPEDYVFQEAGSDGAPTNVRLSELFTIRRNLPQLGRTAAFVGVAWAFAVTMLGTTLPTPLYPIYQQEIGFSGLTVTVIFALYAAGVIAALLLFGELSDQVGRRFLLLPGVGFAVASSMVFVLADGLASLFVGRILSGLSAGIFTGTATAALVDLAPKEQRSRATLVAAAVNMGGLGLGPLVAGILAEVAPAPLRVPFAVHLGLLVPAALAILLMPEPAETASGVRFRLQRLSVPAEVRGTFVRAAVAAFAGFAVFGLFTALTPALLDEILGISNLALVGLVVFGQFAASVVSQFALQRIPRHHALPAGCGGLIAGAALVIGGLAASSLALLIAGIVIAGLGQGLSFGAGLAAVNAESPAERRGEVASSFFVVGYVGLSLPIIGVGVAAEAFGLRAAGIGFSAIVAGLALTALVSLTRHSVGKAEPRPR